MSIKIKTCLIISIFVVSINHCIKTLGAEAEKKSFNYDDYMAVLKAYVNDKGMVNYKQLKANRAKLDTFVRELSGLDPATYAKWNSRDKIAFWINAYNGLTLKAIIDNYPIKSSFFRSRIYPKNSIRQISGVWDEKKFKLMGTERTLEQIEHEILRKQFKEPGIHVSLVCAAMGCPPLRNEPYFGSRLQEQFDDQAHRFLANQKKFQIDRKDAKVSLSPIFKWFAGDFVNKYAPKKNLGRHDKEESAVLNFIASYLDKEQEDYVLSGEFKIKYLDYDWSLNEQQTKK